MSLYIFATEQWLEWIFVNNITFICRPGSVQSLRPGVQMSAQDGS